MPDALRVIAGMKIKMDPQKLSVPDESIENPKCLISL